MLNHNHLIKEAKAWIKRKDGTGEIIRIIATLENTAVMNNLLYTSFDDNPDYLGQILFDAQRYWIYDGEMLTIIEQEQVAKFLINYVRILTEE